MPHLHPCVMEDTTSANIDMLDLYHMQMDQMQNSTHISPAEGPMCPCSAHKEALAEQQTEETTTIR